MRAHPVHVAAMTLALVVLQSLPSDGLGQWLTRRTPGIPRTADGQPNLSAPTPRTSDNKPDLSGFWQAGPKFESDFTRSDALPWAQAQSQRYEADPASGWSVLCLPPGPMINFSGPLKIVQTPNLVAVMYEVPNNFRQIFIDGRELPEDPNPTWQGYSVGRWDGDTLVVETVGFNDRSMVGRPPHPHTDGLRVTERYRRRDFGHIDLQMTVDDPKAFTRSWTITTELVFDPDGELLEFVCNENEKDRQHYVTPQSTSTEIHVDPTVLAKYVGQYRVMTPRGLATATMSLDGGRLMVDVPGIGNGPMIPQSATMFSFRGAMIEFISNEKGDVTHLVTHVVEGDFTGPRLDGPTP